MFTDSELLSHFENKIQNSFFKSDSCLTYDDKILYNILRRSDRLTNCPLCGGELKHSIISRCAGHGDYPRFVVFSCIGRCKFSFEASIYYGDTYESACSNYLSYCKNLKTSIFVTED